jgi:predicted regulator of Ras-like GTPase activity (Roadblock/LC7/MglB family)
MTIHRSWSSLLLEGAKRFDEFHQEDILGAAETAASKDEMINSRIATFLAGSSIFKGVAIADINGAILAVRSDGAVEKDLVGAVVSAMYSFGRRSLNVMSQGKLLYMVVQGDTGCLVIALINPMTLFFGQASGKPDLQKAMEEINHLRTNIFEYV